MPSQRYDLKEKNINQSKNTRMSFDGKDNMDFRKDELMHIGRYWNAVQTMIDVSKTKNRPLKVLDIGCGEMNPVKMLYKAAVIKKELVISEYIGVDVDEVMAKRQGTVGAKAFNACNAKYLIQDLTQSPRLPFEDGYFDVIFCFEFMEHINPVFLPEIIKEACRVLKKDGEGVFSTPNSNGSNKKLPKDHFYEYSYEECISLFEECGFDVIASIGVCINMSRIPKEDKEKLKRIISRYGIAFGRNSPFASVALAPLFSPKHCKNVVYRLERRA